MSSQPLTSESKARHAKGRMVIVQHEYGHPGAWSKDIQWRLLDFAIALEARLRGHFLNSAFNIASVLKVPFPFSKLRLFLWARTILEVTAGSNPVPWLANSVQQSHPDATTPVQLRLDS